MSGALGASAGPGAVKKRRASVESGEGDVDGDTSMQSVAPRKVKRRGVDKANPAVEVQNGEQALAQYKPLTQIMTLCNSDGDGVLSSETRKTARAQAIELGFFNSRARSFRHHTSSDLAVREEVNTFAIFFLKRRGNPPREGIPIQAKPGTSQVQAVANLGRCLIMCQKWHKAPGGDGLGWSWSKQMTITTLAFLPHFLRFNIELNSFMWVMLISCRGLRPMGYVQYQTNITTRTPSLISERTFSVRILPSRNFVGILRGMAIHGVQVID